MKICKLQIAYQCCVWATSHDLVLAEVHGVDIDDVRFSGIACYGDAQLWGQEGLKQQHDAAWCGHCGSS